MLRTLLPELMHLRRVGVLVSPRRAYHRLGRCVRNRADGLVVAVVGFAKSLLLARLWLPEEPQVQTTSGDVNVMYQGALIVGRLAMGVGTLNPAAAIELQAA